MLEVWPGPGYCVGGGGICVGEGKGDELFLVLEASCGTGVMAWALEILV